MNLQNHIFAQKSTFCYLLWWLTQIILLFYSFNVNWGVKKKRKMSNSIKLTKMSKKLLQFWWYVVNQLGTHVILRQVQVHEHKCKVCRDHHRISPWNQKLRNLPKNARYKKTQARQDDVPIEDQRFWFCNGIS